MLVIAKPNPKVTMNKSLCTNVTNSSRPRLKVLMLNQKGFALVATISVMSLVILVALAMISLATVVTRTSGHGYHMEQARANARIALNIAISQLQEYAGRDQVATTRADVMDADIETLVPDGMENPYYTLVVPSIEVSEDPIVGFDLNRRRAGLPAVLVSGNERFDLTGKTSYPAGYTHWGSTPNPSTWVDILPQVGTPANTTEADWQRRAVWVPKVAIKNGSGDVQGRYAYWVSENATKMHLSHSKLNSEQMSIENNKEFAQVPNLKVALSGVADGELDEIRSGLPKKLNSKWQRVITPSTLQLISGQANSDDLANVRHDIAAYSVNLLSDIKNGGLKKDLSTALQVSDRETFAEMANDTDLFDSRALFKRQSSRTTFTNNKVREISKIQAGGSWLSLWEFSRLTDGSGNITPQKISGGEYTSGSHGEENAVDATDYLPHQFNILPVMTRMMFTFDVTLIQKDGKYMPRFHLIPQITLWNPYDVPMLLDEDIELNLTPNSRNQKPFESLVEMDRSVVEYDDGSSVQTAPASSTEFETPLIRYVQIKASNNTVIPPGKAMHFSLNGNVEITDRNSINLTPGVRAGVSAYVDVEDLAFFDGITVSEPNDIDLTLEFKRIWAKHYAFGQVVEDDYDIGGVVSYGPHEHGLLDGRLSAFGNVYGSIEDSGWQIGESAKALGQFRVDFDTVAGNPKFGGVMIKKMTRPRTDLLPADADEAARQGSMFPTRWVGLSNARATSSQAGFRLRTALSYISGTVSNASGAQSILPTIANSGINFSPIGYIDNDSAAPDEFILLPLPKNAGKSFNSIGSLTTFPIDRMINGNYFRFHRFPVDMEPTFPIGNSLAPVGIPLNVLHNNGNTVDVSYLANNALWDRYFFSTLDITNGTIANSRLIKRSADAFSTLSAIAETERPKKVSSHFVQNAPFNVNSTSKLAWKSLLSSMFGDNGDGTFGRYIQHASAVSNGSETFRSDTAGAYMPANPTLSEAQIDLLAERIVREVKLRGPFVSVSQFVNRSIGYNDHLRYMFATGARHASAPESYTISAWAGQPATTDLLGDTSTVNGYRVENSPLDKAFYKGAIQAALDFESATTPIYDSQMKNPVAFGESSIQEVGDYADWRIPTGTSVLPTDYHYTAGGTNWANDILALTKYIPETVTGVSQSFGLPSYITQGDILARIGPQLTARSDTFTVRAYGESVDDSGNVVVSAWCEAVVRRDLEYIGNGDIDVADIPDPVADPFAARFGRRFKMVSFKWVNRNEKI